MESSPSVRPVRDDQDLDEEGGLEQPGASCISDRALAGRCLVRGVLLRVSGQGR